MKFRSAILFVSSVVLLILASCQPQAGGEAVECPWLSGEEGLVADFEEFGTENVIYEDEAFPVVVLLQNKGEFALKSHEVELKIRGISKTDFSGLEFESTNSEDISKVSEFLPDGGYERVNLGEAMYEGLTGTFYDANIYLEYTYPYVTYVSIPKVCFKEDLRDERVCDIEETKASCGSGSPIQIGTVTEKPYGSGKIYLEIPIFNTGAGRSKAYLGDDFSALYDTVAFEVQTAGMECSSRGDPSVARLPRATVENSVSAETTIVCISDSLEENALYTKPVDLTLTYYYQDLASTLVRIKENPELD